MWANMGYNVLPVYGLMVYNLVNFTKLYCGLSCLSCFSVRSVVFIDIQ